ncbi:hypothetical protein MASR2M12_21400 [Bacteroidales bacterium]
MKKVFSFVLVFLVAAGMLHAQESTFGKGDKVLNLGVGLLSGLYSGTGYTSKIPPISASLEYGIADDVLDVGSIGVGGYLGYSAAKWETTYFGGSYGWKYSSFLLGARGSFHYPLVDKLDTYAGIMLGYNIVSSSEIGNVQTGYSASTSAAFFSGYAGARYYFNEKFGVMGEVGTGIAYLNLGIALKF